MALSLTVLTVTATASTISDTSGECPYLCEDGSCVDSPTDCPPYNGCGGAFPILVNSPYIIIDLIFSVQVDFVLIVKLNVLVIMEIFSASMILVWKV